MDFLHGERLLAEYSDDLFEPSTIAGKVRIMVTMPSEAADYYLIVHNLLEQGMDYNAHQLRS
jgi:pyruvate kinase